MTAKTTITEKPDEMTVAEILEQPIIYVFQNATTVVRIPAHNYREARQTLDKWSHGQTGYKLKERIA